MGRDMLLHGIHKRLCLDWMEVTGTNTIHMVTCTRCGRLIACFWEKTEPGQERGSLRYIISKDYTKYHFQIAQYIQSQYIKLPRYKPESEYTILEEEITQSIRDMSNFPLADDLEEMDTDEVIDKEEKDGEMSIGE